MMDPLQFPKLCHIIFHNLILIHLLFLEIIQWHTHKLVKIQTFLLINKNEKKSRNITNKCDEISINELIIFLLYFFKYLYLIMVFLFTDHKL